MCLFIVLFPFNPSSIKPLVVEIPDALCKDESHVIILEAVEFLPPCQRTLRQHRQLVWVQA